MKDGDSEGCGQTARPGQARTRSRTRAAHTIYGLTEQLAAARSGEDQIAQQIKRRCGRFKRTLMTAGFDQLAQLAGAMEQAAGRSSSQRSKPRILREGMSRRPARLHGPLRDGTWTSSLGGIVELPSILPRVRGRTTVEMDAHPSDLTLIRRAHMALTGAGGHQMALKH